MAWHRFSNLFSSLAVGIAFRWVGGKRSSSSLEFDGGSGCFNNWVISVPLDGRSGGVSGCWVGYFEAGSPGFLGVLELGYRVELGI